MCKNRKSNGNLVQFQRKKSSNSLGLLDSSNESKQEYEQRRNELNQVNNTNFSSFSRKNSFSNSSMEDDQKESILELSIDSDDQSDDEFILKESKKIDPSLIAEIVDFILNEKSSKRSLSVLVFSVLK
jgi:hypothetical protein